MAKLTIIARLTDGLVLAEGLEHFRDPNNNNTTTTISSSEVDMLKMKAKELIHRLPNSPSRMSLTVDNYSFHYIVEEGVCYITMCHASYPRKLAFLYLEDLYAEFRKIERSKVETASKPYAFIRFDVVIPRVRKLYLDTRTQRNLSKLHNDDVSERFGNIQSRDYDEFMREGKKNEEALAMSPSPRHCTDIESAITNSETLQRVALKWMPLGIVAMVFSMLLWARMVLRED